VRFLEKRFSGTAQKPVGHCKVFTSGLSTSQNRMAQPSPSMANRLEGNTANVWVEFAKLAVENKALNLGQGFPDFHPPEYIKQALADAVLSPNPFMNQYTRSFGHPRLVNALAQTHGPLLGREVDPNTEILVTVGAYEALFCSVQGLINPGDEALIIEPYFDCYEPMVRIAGGTPTFVPLRPTKPGSQQSSADWKLDPEELESKINSKTKVLFFNNPNNPLGKVYTEEEVQMIADLCIKHDLIVLSDEVYEWLIYKPHKHIKIASLPGMWDRTLTIGSAGKTFSVTGWKLGWAIGPQPLVKALCAIHQNCNYTCATPLQEAVGIAFEKEVELYKKNDPNCYYHSLPEELLPKRNTMVDFLTEVDMIPVVPDGGYFMIADFSQLDIPFDSSSSETKDAQFVKWLTINKKIAAIPPSAFYSKEHKDLAQNLIRFCFIKEDSTLEKAAEIMHRWKATR